jgi:hypothetical protein
MTPPQQNPNVAPQQDMAVLDQVKKQRGKAERLTTEEILQKSSQESGQNPLQLQAALANLVETDPQFRIMRANNTLFMYYNVGNGVVEMLMETADTPRDLIDSVKDYKAAMKAAGYKQGRFDVDNPQMIKVLQMANVKYTLQPGQGVMSDGKTPSQQAIVEF